MTQPPWPAPVYRILSLSFTLQCSDPELDALIRSVLAPFIHRGESAEHHFAVAGANGRWEMRVDEQVMCTGATVGDIYRQFLLTLNRQIEEASCRDWLLLHGACAASEDRAVILSGASEAGKSTLVTALVKAGFSYVTDEFVAVSPTTGLITPVPKHLALDRGSWPLYPELESYLHHPRAVELSPAQWQIPVQRWAPERVVRHEVSPVLLLFISYRRGADYTERVVSPADALLYLARQTFGWLKDPRTNLRRAADLLKRLDCRAVEYADTAPVIDLVRRHLPAAGAVAVETFPPSA